MRKSFILSLVMVVVLIASLATATFAWYTAQTAVSANNVTVYTAGAGDSLVISSKLINDKMFGNGTVTFELDKAGGVGSGVQPAVIFGGSDPTINATTGTSLADFKLITTTVKPNGKAGTTISTGSQTNLAKVVKVTDAANSSITNTTGMIFLSNPGSNPINYTVKVTITDTASAAADGLRVAVFKYYDGTSSADVAGNATQGTVDAYADSTFHLVGIWAIENEDVKRAASFTEDSDPTTAALEATITDSGNGVAAGTIAGGTPMNNQIFRVVAWYEGENITNFYQGVSSIFKVDFNKAA